MPTLQVSPYSYYYTVRSVVLVGTQLDRKWSVPSNQVVLTTKGQALKRQMKAAEFFECSALTKENVKAVRKTVIKKARPRIFRCSML